MGMIPTGDLAQSLPGSDRHFAIGFRRQHEYGFCCVNRRIDASQSVALTVLEHLTVKGLQVLYLGLGIPADAFTAVTQLRHQRSKRGKALIDIGVIALNLDIGRSGYARNQITFTFFPVSYLRLLDFPGASMLQGQLYDISLYSQDFGCNRRKLFRNFLENLPI